MKMFMQLNWILVVVLVGSVHATIAQTKRHSLSDVSAMAGCWERLDESKKLLVSEQWMSVAGTSILGMGRTVKNGKTVGWEFMRIEERDGALVFVSRPRENKEDTEFNLISGTKDKFVFENKAHDFPQRVIYSVSGSNLNGRIEGEMNGKTRAIDFPMKRVKCQ